MRAATLGTLLAELLALACGGPSPGPPVPGSAGALRPQISVATGVPPVVDGVLSPGEWEDAASFGLQVLSNWTITVRCKRDRESLYFAFAPLAGAPEYFPEVAIDARHDCSPKWDDDDWWFHASYNDCDARGRYDVWDCAPTKPGWRANNYPLAGDGAIEIAISYAKFGVLPATGARTVLGLAIRVTDGSDAVLWPAAADIGKPSTWGDAILED